MPSTRTGVLVVAAAVVVLAVLYPLAGGWVWIPGLALLAVGAILLLLGSTGPSPSPPPAAEPHEQPLWAETDDFAPPAPVVPNTTRLRETKLLSADTDFTFVLKGTVRWNWVGEPHHQLRSPEALAQQAVVSAARRILREHGPHEADVARHTLAARLGRGTVTDGGAMEVWAEELDLALSDEDREHLEALARVRKERGQWEAERDVERSKRRYFAEDALSSPGEAVFWELARNGADIDRAEERIQTLARLAEAGKGESFSDVRNRLHVEERTEGPEPLFVLGAGDEEGRVATAAPAEGTRTASAGPQEPIDVLAAAVELVEDDNHRLVFANRFAEIVGKSPIAPLAPALRERFDVPVWAAPAPEEDEGGPAVDGTFEEGPGRTENEDPGQGPDRSVSGDEGLEGGTDLRPGSGP